MNTINQYGAFSSTFYVSGDSGIITVHPEMIKFKSGISPTGRYHVHCIHPHQGTCAFVVEQDHNGTWICTDHPKFVSVCFVSWIGDQIMFGSSPA